MAKLKLQEFIAEHSDWEVLLAEKPYCITITRDEVYGKKLVMFKYSQIDSDFNLEIVRECRGCILDAETFEPVCIPFYKFGNAGESYCPKIDWKSCWVGQKLDGSLIKMVRIGDEILVSTNGTIDAFKAPLAEQIGCKSSTFGELVVEAIWNNDNFRPNHTHAVTSKGKWFEHPDYQYAMKKFKDMLEENNTYMFELTSPFNKVVVTWHETQLNFLGVRNNTTLQETYFTDHPLKDKFNTPKVFPLTSLDECMKAASELDVNEEGYVVCDSHFNRVKVKSPLYVSIHHLRGENGVMSYKRALEIVKANEVDEVLTYFPEYKDAFDKLEQRFNEKVAEVEAAWKEFEKIKDSLTTRKDQAIWIMSHVKEFAGFMFGMLDGKITSIHDAIYEFPNDKIVRMLGFKDA